MRKALFFLPFVLLLNHTGRALAGSVITGNLPTGTAIVNINAQQDGAANYNGDQSLWYSPFSTAGAASLLTLPVTVGTYTFRITDPADAAAEFPALSQAQLASLYTAWTYNEPWITDYFVFDISAATDSSQAQLFDGSPDPTSFGDAQSAYNDAVANGYSNEIRTGPLGRDSLVLTTTYTVTADTTLVFVIPDYDLSDNDGGVSVIVQKRPAFFTGETTLADGVYYLTLPNGNYFGYYSYLTDPDYIYHFDLGYEYVFDAADGKSGVYFYDFTSNDFFYTSPTFPFPYLYDFDLNSVVYYYPNPTDPGHYNTNGYRFFYVFNTGKIITK